MKKTAFSSTLAGTAAAVAISLFSMAPAATSATAAEQLSIQYDVYTRGMRAFALNYVTEIKGNSYKAKAKLRPKGLASLFVNMKMDMNATGTITKKGAVPSHFTMGVKEKKRKGNYTVAFKGLKPVKSSRKPGVGAERAAKLDAAAAKGVRDTLGSFMNLAVAGGKNPCKGKHRVYNGREVFELKLSKIKDDNFHSKDGGVYRGPAIACSMVYSSIAGLSAKTMAKYRKKPPTFRVWFAPVRSKALGRDMNVLVGVTGKIKGKKFVAYANYATLNGKPLNGKSLAKR